MTCSEEEPAADIEDWVTKQNDKKAYYVGNTLAFLMHQAGNIYMFIRNKGTWKTNELYFAKINMTLTNFSDG